MKKVTWPGPEGRRMMSRRPGKWVLLGWLLGLTACAGSGMPPAPADQYIFEYGPPRFEERTPLDGTLKVERFSSAQSFMSSEMVYQAGPNRQNSYPYHRWRVSPGDMVTDFLLRDLRETGLFRAVFSYRDRGAAWFVLQGSLGTFLEMRDENGGRAVLAATLTLLDLRVPDLPGRVLFQKDYGFSTPLAKQGPAFLAEGMSASMAAFSGAAMEDVYRAVREALNRKGP